MSVLGEIAKWYADQCDGEWEHAHGISIQTCDNPGWWVTIDLTGTPLDGGEFAVIAEGIDAAGFPESRRWLHRAIRGGVWRGAGDETRLEEILACFLAWASSPE